MLLARVIPGTPMWMASMAVDPEGTVRLQEQFAKGLAHMVEHPVDALGNMIDVKDLQSGDYAKWLGHLTPDVIVTVLTMGGGGAAAAAGEGVARTASEATAEQVAKTVAEDAARSVGETTVTAAGEKVAATGPARTMDELTGAAASVDAQEARTLANTVERATRPTSEWAAAHEKPPTLRPLSGEPPRMSVDRWRAPISLEHAAQHAIDHAGPGARWSVTVRGNPQLIGLAFKNAEGVMQRNIARVDAWGLRAGEAPHLNLEVQIQGRPMPKLDPHIAIHMGTP
jgi:hypothetical protein